MASMDGLLCRKWSPESKPAQGTNRQSDYFYYYYYYYVLSSTSELQPSTAIANQLSGQ